jgi:cellulose synthase/poly-beta-1,6-N-acetylglucosamine synthase-like glycosyltransferase
MSSTKHTTGPSRAPLLWLFWGAVGLIIYTYAGFPLLALVRGLVRPRPVRHGDDLPGVTMIIAAYNEEAVIADKLTNTQALDYPPSLLKVIVASDGSSDATNSLVREFDAPNVQLLALPRQGKNRTLNAAVAAADSDILVFSDADSMLKPDALRQLVAPFTDPDVGGVGGDYHYASDGMEGGGERTYWSFDRVLKQLQSRSGSMTSATGQIYAMRRALFRPMPDGVTDDFFTSVQVPAAHKRLVFAPHAVAYGPVAATAKAEFRRKVRVMTAGLRGVWLVRQLLNPFAYGYFAVQLFSHKVLRRLMVLPLLVIGVTAPMLWRQSWLYRFITMGQAALHMAALLGFALRHTSIGRNKALSLPFFFDMVNVAALAALWNLVRGTRHDIWVPQREATGDVGADVQYTGA